MTRAGRTSAPEIDARGTTAPRAHQTPRSHARAEERTSQCPYP
jgi:hypothetical protein